MKSHLQLFAVALVLTVGCFGGQSSFAQSAPPSGSSTATTPLTPEDKMKLMKARNQVLQDNPDLKTEAEDLKKQGQALKGGDATDVQKDNFTVAMADHQKKMKAAMLKIDPSLGPIIDQAQAEMKQKMKDRAAGN